MLRVRQFKRTAFSLVELTMVISIIGLLMIAVIKTSDLLYESKLATARSLTMKSSIFDIEGLVLWYETTMVNSLDKSEAIDDEFVNIWYNISGYNPKESYDATAISNPPTYIKDAINGLPVLRFDGDDYLECDMSLLNNSDYTLVIVSQRRSALNRYMIGSKVAFAGIDIRYFNDGDTIKFRHGEGISPTASKDFIIDNYTYPIPNLLVFNYSIKNNKVYPYVNGITINPLTGMNKVPDLSQDILFGGYNGAGKYIGDLSEIIIFNRVLSDAERKDIERYLGKKWGIDVAS